MNSEKSTKKDKNVKKISKANAQVIEIDAAVDQAHKMFHEHEKKRTADEQVDKRVRNKKLMLDIIGKERIAEERSMVLALRKEFLKEEQLAFMEHEKHTAWRHLADASDLPDVHKENEINTFLSLWEDSEAAYDVAVPETVVIVSQHAPGEPYEKLFIRGEQGLSAGRRQRFVQEELRRCFKAYQLAEAIKIARDAAAARGEVAAVAFHNGTLAKVHARLMAALDFVTVTALLYYDKIIPDSAAETLSCLIPEPTPVLKYGLWVKVKNTTRTFNSLIYPKLEIRLDPKLNGPPKLPKALGMSRENVALRVMQFAFDPFDGRACGARREFYALACTLTGSLLDFLERPRVQERWAVRSETREAHLLHEQPYPPPTTEARLEETAFTLSFEVPPTIIIRQPTLLIGKWVRADAAATEDPAGGGGKEKKNETDQTEPHGGAGEWELCSHATFGVGLPGGGGGPRRATFLTSELAHFAVLQKKTFDAPYAGWNLQPVSYDRVVLTLQGRYRGEASDREFVLLVEDAACKLLTPDDAELERLRATWMEPATLFRELAQVGFHFMLDDSDASFIDDLKPKNHALEAKAYADIAHFCQYYIFANTRHNKYGEDPDMALFRMSKKCRGVDEERKVFQLLDTTEESWYSVRYHRDRCVLSAFKESEEVANLSALDGCEPHFDLYTMLLPVKGEETMREQFSNTNYLLRRCVQQILSIIRPLTWG
ncbi:unnamed protein product [Phytomonas sp. EM1]|nr:unnamed protein product [Phytomonas sp. EM1]|eukprot:CCW59865.1 unnamed protein product [Phytomonas sp. isolate EM1]